MTTDVLTSVKKMEESLKRLKKAKGGTVVGEGKTLTDDDKIRLQFHLDVTRLGDYVSIRIRACDVFGSRACCTVDLWQQHPRRSFVLFSCY